MWEKIVIPSEPKARYIVEARILQVLDEENYADSDIFSIRLALEEATMNAIKHGNKLDPDKLVTVRYLVDNGSTTIEVTDQGGGFDLSLVPDPTRDEFIERPCGRGIMLMNAFMDSVEFNATGNTVIMKKYRGRKPEQQSGIQHQASG